MSDRVAGFTVALACDLSEAEAEQTRQAICSIKGVLTAAPIESDLAVQLAYTRARTELYMAAVDALHNELHPKEQ